MVSCFFIPVKPWDLSVWNPRNSPFRTLCLVKCQITQLLTTPLIRARFWLLWKRHWTALNEPVVYPSSKQAVSHFEGFSFFSLWNIIMFLFCWWPHVSLFWWNKKVSKIGNVSQIGGAPPCSEEGDITVLCQGRGTAHESGPQTQSCSKVDAESLPRALTF